MTIVRREVKGVVIFGGSRGIGRVLAQSFLAAGHHVTIAARTGIEVEESIKALANLTPLQESPLPVVQGLVADVTRYEDVQMVLEHHGNHFQRIDVVINAAALQEPIGPVWRNDPLLWQQTILTNLVGSFHICHAVLPLLRKAGKGVIILMSGGGAAYARPHFSAYGCSKTGVLRLVETVHEELTEVNETDIGIYAIAPGAVKTRMTGEVLANAAQAGDKAYREALQTHEDGGTPPEKAAELCLFLADRRPKCLSGRLIHVNEPYHDCVDRFETSDPGERGLLRRQPY